MVCAISIHAASDPELAQLVGVVPDVGGHAAALGQAEDHVGRDGVRDLPGGLELGEQGHRIDRLLLPAERRHALRDRLVRYEDEPLRPEVRDAVERLLVDEQRTEDALLALEAEVKRCR
jgi:hypothetical protein